MEGMDVGIAPTEQIWQGTTESGCREAAAGGETQRCGGGGVRAGWEITPHSRTIDFKIYKPARPVVPPVMGRYYRWFNSSSLSTTQN